MTLRHMPWSGADLPTVVPYRGLTSCGILVPPEEMGCLGGLTSESLTCPECRSKETPARHAARRAASLRRMLRTAPQDLRVDASDMRTLGLEPSDADIRAPGRGWVQRPLREILAMSAARLPDP